MAQEALKRLTIRDEHAQVTFVPERGGIITSYLWDGLELLYLDESTLLDPTKNVRGGIPLLFPLCGPVREGHYLWEGSTHSLGQHGFARSSSFEVIELGQDFAHLRLARGRGEQPGYPFAFELHFVYRLSRGRLTIEQRLINRDSLELPWQIGYHPYFLTGQDKHLEWHIPASRYRDNESLNAGHSTRLEFDFAGAIPNDVLVDWEFPQVASPSASFLDHQRAVRIAVTSDGQFPYVVVWNVPAKPFVCLEPWSGPRFGMNDRIDLLLTAPGQETTTSIHIEASHP